MTPSLYKLKLYYNNNVPEEFIRWLIKTHIDEDNIDNILNSLQINNFYIIGFYPKNVAEHISKKITEYIKIHNYYMKIDIEKN